MRRQVAAFDKRDVSRRAARGPAYGPKVKIGSRPQDRYRLSWWDSLIVSAAQVAECRYLLTEDLQDTQELGKVKIVSPFGITPESLLGR
jgi:hypothetical protein